MDQTLHDLEQILTTTSKLMERVGILLKENYQLRLENNRLQAEYKRTFGIMARLAGLPAAMVPEVSDQDVEAARAAALATTRVING